MAKPAPKALHPLANHLYAGNTVLLEPANACTRISLRLAATELKTANRLLGLKLPQTPKSSASTKQRTALWLGPDEWLILDAVTSDLHELPAKLSKVTCSAVDISHRNTAIMLTGEKAADVLNSGCPQNLSLDVFPVGACSRTILGKSEIILLRTAKKTFHIECWRSFSQYVWKYLVASAKTL